MCDPGTGRIDMAGATSDFSSWKWSGVAESDLGGSRPVVASERRKWGRDILGYDLDEHGNKERERVHSEETVGGA